MVILIRFLVLLAVVGLVYRRGYNDGQIALTRNIESLKEVFDKIKGKTKL